MMSVRENKATKPRDQNYTDPEGRQKESSRAGTFGKGSYPNTYEDNKRKLEFWQDLETRTSPADLDANLWERWII